MPYEILFGFCLCVYAYVFCHNVLLFMFILKILDSDVLI